MKFHIAAIFWCFSVLATKAQLVVNSGYTPQQLVQDVLIGGGVSVSNIQYTGANGAAGFFDGQNSNIGLQSGVLLTTGTASGAVGPNNPFNDTGTDNSLPGDPALTALSGSFFGTFDACILELISSHSPIHSHSATFSPQMST